MAIYTTAWNYFQEGGTLITAEPTKPPHNFGDKTGGNWNKRRNATTISPNARPIRLDLDDITARWGLFLKQFPRRKVLELLYPVICVE
jgi:hypothetical protein